MPMCRSVFFVCFEESSDARKRDNTCFSHTQYTNFLKESCMNYEVYEPSSADQYAGLDKKAIAPWKPYESYGIYAQLEHPNWAPWLEASIETLAGRAKTFPEGQLVLTNGLGMKLASLSLNQIYWDGDPSHLPSWDAVAGDPTDYSQTYDKDGNTLVLMSMNVAPGHYGEQLPSLMVDHTQMLAKALGVSHIIGSFRPSGYGNAKKEHGYVLPFAKYVGMMKEGGDKPLDPWLRSLSWKGMQMLAVDGHAMVVQVPMDQFEGYKKSYHPLAWEKTPQGVWECGEVGSWSLDCKKDIATYVESNVWGSLPVK